MITPNYVFLPLPNIVGFRPRLTCDFILFTSHLRLFFLFFIKELSYFVYAAIVFTFSNKKDKYTRTGVFCKINILGQAFFCMIIYWDMPFCMKNKLGQTVFEL